MIAGKWRSIALLTACILGLLGMRSNFVNGRSDCGRLDSADRGWGLRSCSA